MALQLFKIASYQVENQVDTITFSNIPQGYTDLKLVISGRTTNTNTSYGIGYVRPNGATTNLSGIALEGGGSGYASYSEVTWRFEPNANGSTANTFGNMEVYIPNYTSANYKLASADTVIENNATATAMYFKAWLWSSTAAITSIDVVRHSTDLWMANSTFTLYGIL